MTTPLAFFGGAPGGFEILLIFAALLLLFGAKKVPGLARSIGQMMEELRRTTRDVTSELMRADEDDIETGPPPYQDHEEDSGDHPKTPPPVG